MKGRVLSFNSSTAHVWGQFKAKWDLAGVAVPSLDSQIAATAQRLRSLRKRSGKQVLLPNKRSPLRFERSRSHLAEDTNVFQLVSSLRMHDHQIIVAEDRRGIPVC